MIQIGVLKRFPVFGFVLLLGWLYAGTGKDILGQGKKVAVAPKKAVQVYKTRQPQSRDVVLKEVFIKGSIPRPTAFFILERSMLDFEMGKKSTSFIPKILESVNLTIFH